ncbi:MAG: hypothetical protein M1409_02405, partial [Actinobacteria bacterium]|nr:hypothetical protein [Actinomycetota bacterium]
DIDLLILWGGFPEIFAKQLSDNESLKKAIVKLYRQGLPIYAEYGGKSLQKKMKKKDCCTVKLTLTMSNKSEISFQS